VQAFKKKKARELLNYFLKKGNRRGAEGHHLHLSWIVNLLSSGTAKSS
jgi:hypothetical protein